MEYKTKDLFRHRLIHSRGCSWSNQSTSLYLLCTWPWKVLESARLISSLEGEELGGLGEDEADILPSWNLSRGGVAGFFSRTAVFVLASLN